MSPLLHYKLRRNFEVEVVYADHASRVCTAAVTVPQRCQRVTCLNTQQRNAGTITALTVPCASFSRNRLFRASNCHLFHPVTAATHFISARNERTSTLNIDERLNV